MFKALIGPVAIGVLVVSACSSVRTVVMPDATKLGDSEKAFIWKEYKGMYVSMDGKADESTETFTQYTVAPGKHQVEVTIVRLIKDTGYTYSGKPLTWNGVIEAKAGHRYLIMAKENEGATGIELYTQDQEPPDFEKVTDVALANLIPK
jgi:hypothetical protein